VEILSIQTDAFFIVLIAFAFAVAAAVVYYVLWHNAVVRTGPSDVTMKVFDLLPQPVFFFDDKGLIRYFNTYSQEVLGIKQEYFADLPMETLFRNEAAIRALKKQVALAGTAGPEKLSLRSAYGGSIVFNLSFSELKGTLGDYYGIVAYGEDAREAQKLRAEIERREKTEKNLLALSDSLEDMVDQRTKELTESIGEAQREMNERLKKEDLLRSAIADMEHMLGEVHNRQTKNMKLIINMLKAEQWKGINQVERKKMKILYHRVKAMQRVYEYVFLEGKMELVDFQSFLTDMTDRYQSIYFEDKPVAITLNIDDENLQIDQAFPFGLACNEIFRQAFDIIKSIPDHHKPEVFLSFRYNRLFNTYLFKAIISPLPDSAAKLINEDNYDLYLAKMLVEDQLNGKIRISSEKEFYLKITFDRPKQVLPWRLN